MKFLIISRSVARGGPIERALNAEFPQVQLARIPSYQAFESALLDGPFDLVLTDHEPERIDGFRVLQTVKALRPAVPVVMVTDAGSEELAVDGMKAGLSDYVPLRLAERLPAVIRRCLEEAAAPEEPMAGLSQREIVSAETTARLRAENAELERVICHKAELLAAASHEFRTPLTAILGLTEALLEGVYGPIGERQGNALRTIGESGRHLMALANDFLDLSKIEAGKADLRLEPVDIESLGNASLELIAQAARTKDIQISAVFDPQVTTIEADERRLKQILVNLLSNAVKFTPRGGAIGLQVAADLAQRTTRFTVWDTGIGIAPEDLPRLFMPFVQLNSRLEYSNPGTGLGLALVRRLVELHGGSISVDSVPGKGSRFTVSLPG